MSPTRRVVTIYVIILAILPQIAVQNIESNLKYRPVMINRRIREILPYFTNEQSIRQLQSLVNAYDNKEDSNGELFIERNALVDTKYRTWKRNADLINSLLALPMGMNEAGR